MQLKFSTFKFGTQDSRRNQQGAKHSHNFFKTQKSRRFWYLTLNRSYYPCRTQDILTGTSGKCPVHFLGYRTMSCTFVYQTKICLVMWLVLLVIVRHIFICNYFTIKLTLNIHINTSNNTRTIIILNINKFKLNKKVNINKTNLGYLKL